MVSFHKLTGGGNTLTGEHIDDSSSMKREGRWAAQRNLVEHIARIATMMTPEDEGVSLRFINQDVDRSSNLSFQDIQDILKSTSWHPSGDTQIGTHLRSKILEPMVYRKLGVTKTPIRPLLISVITDGAPSQENETEFEDAILECGDTLEATGYPRDCTFLFSLALLCATANCGRTARCQVPDQPSGDRKCRHEISQPPQRNPRTG